MTQAPLAGRSATARGGAAAPRASRRPGARAWSQGLTTVGVVVAGAAAWTIGSLLSVWPRATVPPLVDVVRAGLDVVRTGTFWSALAITTVEILASFAGALATGFLLGALFWKVPYVGRISEPYLTAFYAVPFIVFYPVMVVIIGLNSWPIIVLATTMSLIPMALNTWIGLAGVQEVYWKLAASLECTRRQALFRIAIPAAAPIILAGVRLAGIYALIGSVSMEFLLAPNGLGFQVRHNYETFSQSTMVFYMLVILFMASVMAFSITTVESRIVGRRLAR